LKKIILVLSIVSALGLALAAIPVLADGGHGALRVATSFSPRFPVVGEEATLNFIVSFEDGTPGAGQEVMIMMMKSEAAGHGHEGEEPAPEENQGGMAGMNHGEDENEEVPMIHLVPEEISPGVYSAKHSFEVGGRYMATVNVLGDEVDVVVPVRAAPIAWWYVGGLAGLSVLMAAMVAVVKTARRSW